MDNNINENDLVCNNVGIELTLIVAKFPNIELRDCFLALYGKENVEVKGLSVVLS